MQLKLAPKRLDQRRERALVASLGPFEVDGHPVNDTRSVGNGPAIRSGVSRCLLRSTQPRIGDELMQKQRWLLVAAALASFLVGLDALIVTTALPTIGRDLGASPSGLEWAVNAYALSFAVLLMCAAAPGDRYGRRRMFSAGATLFSLESAGSLR
jgi:hypothetical protein